MNKKVEICEDGFAVGDGYSRLRNHFRWTDGVVVTRYGIVVAFAASPLTKLEIVRDGRVYIRTYHNKRYTNRGITAIAHRFARDVFNPEDNHD